MKFKNLREQIEYVTDGRYIHLSVNISRDSSILSTMNGIVMAAEQNFNKYCKSGHLKAKYLLDNTINTFIVSDYITDKEEFINLAGFFYAPIGKYLIPITTLESSVKLELIAPRNIRTQ